MSALVIVGLVGNAAGVPIEPGVSPQSPSPRSFVAMHDDPGLPGSGGWQLLAAHGARGERGSAGPRGEKGDRGTKGDPGLTITAWKIDPATYRAVPLMSDSTFGPALELRPLFEHFVLEASLG